MAEKLAEKARQYRLDVLEMLYTCQSGHPGGSLSCVEILQALYENVLKYDPKNPKWADRDRMVLSKGHACPTLYAVLADKGFFPREELKTLRAFKRVDVKAGQEVTETIQLSRESFEGWDVETNTMRFVPGTYDIFVGNSSADKDLQRLTVQIQ